MLEISVLRVQQKTWKRRMWSFTGWKSIPNSSRPCRTVRSNLLSNITLIACNGKETEKNKIKWTKKTKTSTGRFFFCMNLVSRYKRQFFCTKSLLVIKSKICATILNAEKQKMIHASHQHQQNRIFIAWKCYCNPSGTSKA